MDSKRKFHNFLKLVTKTIHFLIYGGAWTIKPYEKVVLDEFSKSLTTKDKAVLQKQLNNLIALHRAHQRKLVTLSYYRKKELPLFPDKSEALIIAKYKLKSGKNSCTVAIETHLGILFSLRFSRDPNHLLRNKSPIVIEKTNENVADVAEEMDRMEHG